MSPKRCLPTTACACCCATNSASPRARPCKASTGVCWARGLGRRPRKLLGLRQEVRARDLADEIRVVLPHVLLAVLPELVVVLALDDVATDARDLLHALIVTGKPEHAATADVFTAPSDPVASKLRKLEERSRKGANATVAFPRPKG